MKSFKDHSRIDWHNITRQKSPSMEDIQIGAIQRIADATEKMAANYIAIQEDRDRYKRWYNEQNDRIIGLSRRISALQGVITRLKKKSTKS